MNPAILQGMGGILGGIGSVGSLFGSSGGMTQGQMRDQRFMNDFAWKQSLRQEQFQNQLATHGIRMRVADAEAAGLHPLAALGTMPSGGSPVTAAFVGSGGSPSRSNLWEGLRGMGQDISRSAMAMATPEEKAYKALQLERYSTENEIAKLELAERRKRMLNDPGTGPGTPGENAGYTIGGQPDMMLNRIKVNPSLVTASERGAAQQSAGANPMFDIYSMKRSRLGLLNQKAAEATEDDYLAKLGIHIQGLFSGREGPQKMVKNFKVPAGYERWAYGGPIFGYVPVRKGKVTMWEAMHQLKDIGKGYFNFYKNYRDQRGRYYEEIP